MSTVMKMLGHESPEMTIRYARIYDETLKKDYLHAIDKAIAIAGGEYAEQLKKRELQQINSNFYKVQIYRKVMKKLDYQYKGGSYNYTKSADKRNVENVTIITDAKFAQKYVQNWLIAMPKALQLIGYRHE